MFVTTHYFCEQCNRDYESKADAIECCSGRLKVKHRCGQCNVYRKDYDKALICCTDYKIVDGSLILERRHILKTWPEYFAAIKSGEKSFEVRVNDRGFKVGDLLVLREWLPGTQNFTGDEVTVKVTYLLQGVAGLPENLCVMSIEEPPNGRAIQPRLPPGDGANAGEDG